MISLILGPERFRAGTDLYFERHDGQAVTIEDFIAAMEAANDIELRQFRNWYSQAGTPVLAIEGSYDAEAMRYTLSVKQSCPDTPGQSNKQPFHIPLRVGLIGAAGTELPLKLAGAGNLETTDLVLDVCEESQQFVFEDVRVKPVPSLLRSFSAPVRLQFDYSREELFFLMVHDNDGFNRWNASQLLGADVIQDLQRLFPNPDKLALPEVLRNAYAVVLDSALEDSELDQAMIAQLLILPTEGALIEQAQVADVDSIHGVREFLANQLARALKKKFAALYHANCDEGKYAVDARSMARRSLKNLALSYLLRTGEIPWLEACNRQFTIAANMTDQFAALKNLVNSDTDLGRDLATDALDSFYQQWRHEPLVVDQWFAVQATSQLSDTLGSVKQLLHHECFEIRNPNKVRSLIGAYCSQNHIGFHASGGDGYEFLSDQVLTLDKLNPQIAARLLTPLTRWRKFDEGRQALMQVQLQRIKAATDLSRDVFEIVEKSTI
jgi:aminopeptidase N